MAVHPLESLESLPFSIVSSFHTPCPPPAHPSFETLDCTLIVPCFASPTLPLSLSLTSLYLDMRG
eukprot:m.365853 g.365853  ORF g.365853 m.365853 type:complete len:65 (+) comp33450_c0_seq1:53-247(+)